MAFIRVLQETLFSLLASVTFIIVSVAFILQIMSVPVTLRVVDA